MMMMKLVMVMMMRLLRRRRRRRRRRRIIRRGQMAVAVVAAGAIITAADILHCHHLATGGAITPDSPPQGPGRRSTCDAYDIALGVFFRYHRASSSSSFIWTARTYTTSGSRRRRGRRKSLQARIGAESDLQVVGRSRGEGLQGLLLVLGGVWRGRMER